ncbi:MAG: type II toxin-antitoxin system VapC family toxin [Thermoplasmata archaeon]|nr:type II toxin-antitoxin system VapC family toxin [Thermoplasmata archaeon]
MKRTYIDSCVFVYHLFQGEKPLGKAAKQFLTRLEDGEFHGVISPFVILEIHTVGRRILVLNTKKTEEEIEEDVTKEMVRLAEFPNLSLFPTPSHPLNLNKIFLLAFPFLKKYFGRIESCGQTRKTPEGRDHRALYTVDLIHLATAISSECDEFATTDRLFEDVDEPSITVQVLRP